MSRNRLSLLLFCGLLLSSWGCSKTSNTFSFEDKVDWMCLAQMPDLQTLAPPFAIGTDTVRDDGDSEPWLDLDPRNEMRVSPSEMAKPRVKRFNTWLSGTVVPTCEWSSIKWKGSLFGRQEYDGCYGHTVFFFDIEIHDSSASCSQLKAQLSTAILAHIRQSIAQRVGRIE